MGRAKEITMKVIPSSIANPFIKAHHYSGKVVNNSKLHFGVFLDGQLHGVMSYGPSLDKSKIIGLVEGTGWNEFLELNRMAFDSVLPRNSESRAISMSIKLLKKYAPQVKWIGKAGNPLTFRVVNNRLAFYMNDTEVAYLSNSKLYVTQAEILARLQIGKFAYEPQSNGNLSVIYTG